MPKAQDTPGGTPSSVPGAGPPRQLHERLKTDETGSPLFRNIDPGTTTGSVQVTGGGSTTTVFTSTTADGAAVLTQMQVSHTTAGTAASGTLELRRAGSVIASTNGTASGSTTTTNMLTTATRDATLDLRITLSATGANTATINVTALTMSRESLWTS